MLEIQQRSVAELIDKELLEGRGYDAITERFQNSVIVHALKIKNGNISQAAVLLKTPRNNLIRWMKAAGLTEGQQSTCLAHFASIAYSLKCPALTSSCGEPIS